MSLRLRLTCADHPPFEVRVEDVQSLTSTVSWISQHVGPAAVVQPGWAIDVWIGVAWHSLSSDLQNHGWSMYDARMASYTEIKTFKDYPLSQPAWLYAAAAQRVQLFQASDRVLNRGSHLHYKADVAVKPEGGRS